MAISTIEATGWTKTKRVASARMININSQRKNWVNVQQTYDDLLDIKELSRRRMSNLIGEPTVTFTPENSEFDEMSIEELLNYDI